VHRGFQREVRDPLEGLAKVYHEMIRKGLNKAKFTISDLDLEAWVTEG